METPPVSPRNGLVRRVLDVRKRMSWKQAWTALKYPNYRLWFWSQIVSLFGSWMESTALGFLVYDLTRSPAYLGMVGFATGVPTWFFMLYAGVIADRFPRRTLLMITQTAMMLLAFGLAALTFLRLVEPWHILVIAALLGTLPTVTVPDIMPIITKRGVSGTLLRCCILEYAGHLAIFNSALSSAEFAV